MTHFDIRPARPEDAATVSELIHALARYEELDHQCTATPESVYEELFCDRSIIRCVLAWEQGPEGERPVGFALYFFNFSTFLTRRGLYLEDLFVVPEARRSGCGRRLIRYLAREAVKEGCGRFEWVVLDWNQPAIDFYQKLGATILNDWRICRVDRATMERLAAEPDEAASQLGDGVSDV